MQTLNYRYRIRRVLSDQRRVLDEIRAGHRLYNDLVAIERTRRDETRRYWAELGSYTADIDVLATAISAAESLPKGDERRAAWVAIGQQREALWDRERATMTAHQHPAKARRKERAAELRAVAKDRGERLSKDALAQLLDREPDCCTPRDRLRQELVAQYRARGIGVSAKTVAKRLREAGLAHPTEHIDQKAREAAYRAYQERGVTAGTRAVIAEAHERSLEMIGMREQRFSRWDGAGAFGVQIQDGALLTALNEQHTQAQIIRLPSGNKQPGSRRDNRHLLRIRIGSEGKTRAPVWSEFELVLHRPLPPEARVVGVKVLVDRVGVHDQWYAVLTANVPDDRYRVQPERRAGSVVAIDIGWRSALGDLRVGYWADDQCHHGELTTPSFAGPEGPCTMRQKLEHARGLQSLLSELFYREDRDAGIYGGILMDVHAWLQQHATSLPEWLAHEAKTLRAWRSQPRLNWLAEKWLANRFDGDAEIVAQLNVWRRKWRHLHDWEARERRHVLAKRDEHYRQIATMLARDYETVIVNGADLASTRRRKGAKSAAPKLVMVEDRKRAQAFDAAPGELRQEIVRAADKYHATVVPLKFDSMTCHACGALCAYDRDRNLRHECERCGAEWDQDHNACRNALREWSGGGRNTGAARGTGKLSESHGSTAPHDGAMDAVSPAE